MKKLISILLITFLGLNAQEIETNGSEHSLILDNNKPKAQNLPEAKKHYDYAMELFVKKEYTLAVSEFTKAINADTNFVAAYVNRGDAKFKLEHYAEAVSDYSKAIKLEPTNAKWHYNKGLAKKELKKYDQAIVNFNVAIKLDPKFELAYFKRADIHYELNQFSKSIRDMDTVISINPTNDEAYVWRAIYTRYNIFSSMIWKSIHYVDTPPPTHGPKVMADLNKCIRLNPKNLDAYAERALAKIDLNDLNGAISDYDTLLMLDSTLIYAIDYRGREKFNLKKYKQALTDFELYIKKNSKSDCDLSELTEVNYYKARCMMYLKYPKNKVCEQAKYSFTLLERLKAIESDPNNSCAQFVSIPFFSELDELKKFCGRK